LTSEVVIIYLDLESYLKEKQNPNEPWSRALYAQLLRRLTQAGARAVVFDVIFDQPGKNPSADAEFAEAIRANKRVILAAELDFSSQRLPDQPGSQSASLALPFSPFLEAAAGWGLAKLFIDDDLAVRRLFPGLLEANQPSLALATATFLHQPVPEPGAITSSTAWVRYYGPPLALPHVSLSAALDPLAADDSCFRDKIVFVGARPITAGFNERKDEFRTPFSSWSKHDLFMPAVEIHATETLNLIHGDWLHRLPSAAEEWLLIATAFGACICLLRIRPLPATAAAIIAEVVIALASQWAFDQKRLWFPWLIISAVQVPGALISSILFNSVDWYRTRRRLEALSRAALARIREQAALLDKAQDAILVQDLQNRVLYANPGAERLYGWSARELQREEVAAQLFAPAAGKLAEARLAVLSKGEWLGELEQATRSGLKLIVESRWTLIRDDARQPKSILLINTDVTEKKRLEAQFLRNQRMDTIGALAGGMAHDLNNALAPILMGIQLISRKIRDEEMRQMLRVMEANTTRGADLVRQVLTFSRGLDGQREPLNIGRLVREMEHIVRQTLPKSIRVAALVPHDLWPVHGNATQVHQVLLNLCVNARDAMPDGGELTLAADNVDLDPSTASSMPDAAPGHYVMLLVSDTGLGIPSDVLPHIFEPHFTTKDPGKGTGLGLATVARIVRNHAGFITVKSEAAAGTTFEVYLPRADTAVAAASIAVQPAPAWPRGKGELVLLIEDDRSVREMVASSLSELGYRVTSAANGAEALSFLAETNRSVRLVLADLSIPPVDGADTLTLVHARCPNTPMILMSGELDSASTIPLVGATVMLPKPFGLEQLLKSITQAFADQNETG
jgi:two-component system, cell cycle sensor histidine kinase and response regulator CckA